MKRARSVLSQDAREATHALQRQSDRFMRMVFANAGSDLSTLKDIPPARRLSELSQPWRGAAGRTRAAEVHRHRTESLRARALALRSEGATTAQIAVAIGRTERMVRNYLDGNP